MYGVDMRLTDQQAHELLSIVGDHSMPEHEWVRACHLLGDFKPKPKRGNGKRLLSLAACALLVVGVAIPWYINYMQSHQSFDIVPPPPPTSAAVAPADLSDYMSVIQRRIKSRWFPPAGNESRRVVVDFSLNRDGSLQNLRLAQSSGFDAVDRAAIKAVRRSAPFPSLPAAASDPIKVQFTFDSNPFHKGPMPRPALEPGAGSPEHAS